VVQPLSGLHVEDREDGVRILTLANPARRNALDDALVARLEEALTSVSGKVRALLIRGEGGTFCSGYDLNLLSAPTEGRLPDDALMACLSRLENHPVPSVALVRGWAFGAGFDLAASCDFRVGAENAVFCMPPARLGIVYSPDGLTGVARLVGVARAKGLFLTGRQLDAREARDWGLLDEWYPTMEAEEQALALCQTLASQAPLAVAGMKESFGLLSRSGLSSTEKAHLREVRARAFASEDAREGRAAFLEKRTPRFRGC
jgi:enoyl-CoA hydratase/carnithine racemase